MTWSTIAAVGLLGFCLGVCLGLVRALTKRVRLLEAAQVVTTRSALLYEASLSPLHQELRHLSESLRQLQELHPAQSHPHPTSPRLFTFQLPWSSRIVTIATDAGKKRPLLRWSKGEPGPG